MTIGTLGELRVTHVQPGGQRLESMAQVELPSMMQCALELVQVLESADATLHQVVRALGRDPALVSRILRLANSSFYGPPKKIGTLSEAVTLLGFAAVRSLALVSASHTWSKIPARAGVEMLDMEMLWRHCLLSAFYGSELAAETKACDPELAFGVGILQNIGLLALQHSSPELVSNAIRTMRFNGSTFKEAEWCVFASDHAEIGAQIAEAWNLPDEYAQAIRWHHSGCSTALEPAIEDIGYLSHTWAIQRGFFEGIESRQPMLDPEVFERLRLSTTRAQLIEKVAWAKFNAQQDEFSN